MQQIIEVDNQYKQIDNYLLEKKIKKIFLVCGGSIKKLTIGKYFMGFLPYPPAFRNGDPADCRNGADLCCHL